MKKFILPFTLFILSCIHSDAQKFSFGPSWKAGISNILLLKTDTIKDHTFNNRVNFSFQAGAYTQYDFAKHFSAGVELLYWLQNGKLKDQFTYNDGISGKTVNETDVYKAYLSYVAIPLYFEWAPSDIILLLGGQYGILFSQSGSIKPSTTVDGVTTEGEKTSRDPNFENYDVGFKAGVLYKLGDNFTAGVEYYNGRVNLSKNNDDPFSSHNQYFYGAFRYNIVRGKAGQMYYN